jgi:ligand-binding sensor domain-containing protein/GAF domain-containing protein/two-component sensor histidine kinase
MTSEEVWYFPHNDFALSKVLCTLAAFGRCAILPASNQAISSFVRRLRLSRWRRAEDGSVRWGDDVASRDCNWRILLCGSLSGLLLVALVLSAAAGPAPAHVAQIDASAAQPPPSATLRFEHLGIERGLSQSTVATILQDRYGFMWFGTDDGLNRYDGYRLTIYRHDPDDPASLSQGSIRGIFEDSTGALWLRTSSGGLDRYDRDRNRFIHYRRPAGGIGTLAEDFIWDLYEDRGGTVWAGAYLSGLYRYDRAGDIFLQYRHAPDDPASLSDDRVYAILEDSAGQFWVGTAAGLDRLDRERERFAHYQHDPDDPATLAGERVQLIREDRQGRLWIATYGTGLNLFDRTSGRVTRYVHDPAQPQSIDQVTRISDLYEDSRGDLWVRHFDGRLDRFDPETGVFRRFRHDPAQPDTVTTSADPAHDNVSFVKEDRNGNLWIGTFGGGLDRFDAGQELFVHYRHAPYDPGSLSDNQLLAFYEDRAGGLWIGTYGHGLNRFDPAQLNFPRYRIEPQALDAAENNVVLYIRADRAGLIWVGSTAGLSSFDRTTGKVTRYRHDPQDPTSLSAGGVWSVFEDAQDRLWIGTETGLDRLDRTTGRFTHFKNTADDPDASYGIVSAITDDGAGGLWLGVYGRGLERFDPSRERFTHYEYHLGEVQANKAFYWGVWTVYPDRSGRVWIGTTKGLYGLDPKTGAVDQYRHDPADPTSISGDEVHAVFEDAAGSLWIGTWGGGLNRLDRATGKFSRYSINDGLPNNTVYCIQEAAGRLWLSTNNGLSRFDPMTRAFRNFDESDGLQSNEFNTGACSATPRGEMLFGGVNGFNAFFPDRVRESSVISPVVLTALTSKGKALSPDRAVEGLGELTLRWPEDSFEFEFASLSYSNSGRNRYAYMLAPLETEWTQIGDRRFGSYTNLPGGVYTLRLKGSEGAGIRNEAGISLKLTVIPPFWETWLFRALLLLALAGIGYGAYRWRIASIQSRNRQLAMEVAERTLTIAGQTADLEALYQADEELERHVQLDQVLQALVDIAVDLLNADKSAVLAWDERRERLVIRVARNFSAEGISQINFGPGEGYVGQVMASGSPVMVGDAEAELRRVPERPEVIAAVLGEGIRSFMHIPIRPATAGSGQSTGGGAQPGEIFGVFTVGYGEPRAFGEREQRLFTALAQRAALAVQNAQYFAAEQRRAEQFRVIGEVGRSLASILDVKELLEEIVRLVQKTFGYDHVGLALIEGDEAVYRVAAGKLWEDPEFTFAPNRLRVGAEGITGWVAGSGEPLLAPDVSQEPRYVWMRGCSTRSELAVPLKVAGRVTGVLDCQSDRLNAFDESDLTVMQSLANQAAIAIENARLYESSSRQVAQLTALQETNRAVASTLERDALLALIMEQATTLLQADGGMINLVDWEKREDEVVAFSGAAAQFMGAHGPLNTSLSGWVTLHNQPVISNHLVEDIRVAPAASEWLAQAHIESAALAPLTIKERVAGTLVLIKEDGKGGFSQADLDLLVAFADQAAIAIENARLYEEAHQVAASQERSRLARDLHDAVTQTLFSASLIAEVLPGLWENDPAEGRQLLGDLRQLTRGALAEMRTLLLELRPAALVEANLGDLLRQLAESVSGRTGIPVAVSLEGCPVPDLPDDVHVALYRIAQEGLNNVVKHAQAHRAEIRLWCAQLEAAAARRSGAATKSAAAGPQKARAAAEPPSRVKLTIADDGHGFDPGAVPLDHLGLGIIRERSQAIGAALRIDSRPGQGTAIEVDWSSGRDHGKHSDSRPHR